MKVPCPNYKVFSEAKHQTPSVQAQNWQFRKNIQKGISQQTKNYKWSVYRSKEKTTKMVGKQENRKVKKLGRGGSPENQQKRKEKPKKRRYPNFDYKWNQQSNGREIRQRRWPNFKHNTKQNKSPKSRGRRRDNQPFIFNNQNFQTPLDKQNPTWGFEMDKKKKETGRERIEWLATKSK